MPVHEFEVAMTCEGCSNALNRILERNKAKGVAIDKYEVNLATKKVTIDTNLSQQEIKELLEKAGKEVTYIETRG